MKASPSARPAHSLSQWTGFNILIAMLYFSTGTVGLALASPPGYATSVWPPSGIALGAILLLGWRILPGICLGSFAASLLVTIKGSGLDILHVSWTPPLIIAIGAGLQAAAGRWLIRSHAPLPDALSCPAGTVRLLGWGGLVSTLVNATWSIGLLCLLHVIPVSRGVDNWMTWWLGDSIGVFIFTPLVLVWAYRAPWFHLARAIVVTTVLAGAFSLSTLGFSLVSRLEAEYRANHFQAASDRLVSSLDRQLSEYSEMSRQVRSLYVSSQFVDRQEFHDFVGAWLAKHPEVRSVDWAPRVTVNDRANFEARLQRETGASGILDRSPRGTPSVSGKRAEYLPLEYTEPMASNRGALGYDLLPEPSRRQALELAAMTGEPRLSSPLTLPQGRPEPIPAFLLYTPVFKHGVGQPGWDGLQGFVIVALEPESVVRSFARRGLPPGYRLTVTDEGSGKRLFGEPPAERLLTLARVMGLHFSSDSAIGGRLWRIDIWPDEQSLSAYESWLTWAVLTIGLGCTGLLVSLAMIVFGRQHQLENALRDRDREREELRQQLAQSRITAGLDRENTRRLLAGFGRELRTAVNAIVGYADLAMRGDTPEKRPGWLAQLQEHERKLERLLDDISDLTPVEREPSLRVQASFHLDDVLDRLAAIADPATRERGLEFRIEVATDVPDRLSGDERRLVKLLGLLSEIALDSAPVGRLIWRITRLESREGDCSLEFRLSCPGGNPVSLAQVFPDTAATETPGVLPDNADIALPIALGLVRALGASSSLGELPGGGSWLAMTVGFTLPRPTPAEQTPSPLSGRLVRLHTTDIDRRRFLTELLRRLDVGVLHGGVEPPETDSPEGGAPDLILLDGPALGHRAFLLSARLREQRTRLPIRICLISEDARTAPGGPGALIPRPLTPGALRRGLLAILESDSFSPAPSAPDTAQALPSPSWQYMPDSELLDALQRLDGLLRRRSFDAREIFETLLAELQRRHPQPAHEMAVSLARLDFQQARLHLAVIVDLLEAHHD